MLSQLELAPPDAILGLTEAFNQDSNPNKINLSVGVYKNEQGVTPVLPSVKEAERRIFGRGKHEVLSANLGLGDLWPTSDGNAVRC